MAEKLTINDLIDALPHIDEKRNYWFVRTQAGDYYEDFMRKGMIAIGYDKIKLSDIKVAHENEGAGVEMLAEVVRRQYGEDEARPNLAAAQLIKFAYEIKKGDIILIPSAHSRYISFGEVLNGAVQLYDKKPENADDCPHIKRKKVKWFKTILRDDLDPVLYRLMFSHHTITNANDYDQNIDKITNSLFIKGTTGHLIIEVETKEDIKAKDLFGMGLTLLDLLDDFSEEERLKVQSKDIDVKLNLQSPGFIELSGESIAGIILIGLILVAIAGGGFTVKTKGVNVSLKTDGIIEKIRRFLVSRSNVKTKTALLQKHMKDLNIKNPEDLIKVIEELNKK